MGVMTFDPVAYQAWMNDGGDECFGDSPTIKDQIVMEEYALMKITAMAKAA